MDQIFEIQGKKICYSDIGKGPVIVFLHGWMESKKVFDGIIEILSKKYRCISIDLPGFGKSDIIENVTLLKISSFVETILNKIGVKKYNLVGHSLGGAVTLVFADMHQQVDKHQDDINKIVLISPFISFRQFPRYIFYVIQNFIPTVIDKILSLKKPNLKAINAFRIVYLLSNTDLYKYLRKVRKDILLVYGTKDPVLKMRRLQPLFGVLNNIHLAVFEDVRHFVVSYNPKDLAEKINLFFSCDTIQ